MNLRLLFTSLCVMAVLCLHAKTWTIAVQDYKFTPASETISLGDTVLFSWIDGSHTTTSRVIPAGAASWDHAINSGSKIFTYVPTVAGTYNYVCVPHESMGHKGSFVVSGGSNSISEYDFVKTVFDVYPNPSGAVINLVFQKEQARSVAVVDLLGKEVMKVSNASAAQITLNVASLSNGIYFALVMQDSKIYVKKFRVAQ